MKQEPIDVCAKPVTTHLTSKIADFPMLPVKRPKDYKQDWEPQKL